MALSRLVLPLLTLSTLAGPVFAANPKTHQVSAAGVAQSDVTDLPAAVVAPDGRTIVYVHDADENEAHELWAVRRWIGSVPVRLSDNLPAGRAIVDFEITPDSSTVVYLADQDADNRFELYSVPLDGSDPAVVLNPTLASGGDVLLFTLSFDGARAVFLADVDTDEEVQLWSVPVDGPSSQADLLSPDTLIAGEDVLAFAITPNSSRVAFAGAIRIAGVVEIFTAPTAGGASVRLSDTASGGANGVNLVPELGFAVSNTRALFAGDFTSPGVVELWSAPIASAGGADPVHAAPVTGGNVTAFEVAATAGRVVFRGDLLVDERYELWSAAADGSGSEARLSESSPTAEGDVFEFDFGPGAAPRVVFRADSIVDERFDLFSRAIDGGGSPTRLNPTTVGAGDVEPGFAVSPDGARVVLRGDLLVDERIEVWSASTSGAVGSAAKINPNPPAAGDIDSFAITATSSHVVYAGDGTVDGRVELWGVPIAGPTTSAVKLHAAAGANENVGAFALSPDGARVAFLADLEPEGPDMVWMADVGGAAGNGVAAHAAPVAGGNALAPFGWSPESLGVLFRGDLLTNDKFDLWLADHAIFWDGFESGDLGEWSFQTP